MKNTEAPKAPDPTATAAAQTASNEQTAAYQQGLNLINQKTPLGSLTYTMTSPATTSQTITGYDSKGKPIYGSTSTPAQYSATTNLTPEGQKSFDLQQQVANSLDNLALNSTKQVQSAEAQPLSYSGLPTPTGINLSSSPSLKPLDLSGLPSAPTSLDTSNLNAPTGLDLSNVAAGPTGLDTSKINAIPTADTADTAAARDALYNQATSRLDPQFDLEQKQLETQLINKGITQGSAAWNNALDQFGRTKNDAYTSAENNAVSGAADYENTLFGMSNTAYNDSLNQQQQALADALNIRQEGVNEAQTGFTDSNTAYQDKFAQAQQQFADEQAARSQGVSEKLSATDVANAERAQTLQEQQAANSAALANRQQGVSEADYLRELPINETSALLNGGQVSMPSFTNTPQTSVANTNTAGIIQNSFEDQYQNYETQMSQQNAILGSIFGTAGSAISAWIKG